MGNGLNASLDIASQTLQNTQIALQTASHNIANADNTSYARQEVDITANQAMEISTAWLGTGASVSGISEDRDQFLDSQLLDATTQKSGYKTLSSQLDSASSIISDNGSTGISQALGAFWDSWDSLSQDPTGTSASTDVQGAASNLVSTIQQTYNNIENYAQGVQSEISSNVSQANTLMSEIAQANEAIVKSEAGGQSANDLIDTRFQYESQLAQLLPIQRTQQSNGAVTITLKGTSTNLVDGYNAATLSYDGTNYQYAVQDATTGVSTNYPQGLGGGTLDSLNKVYQEFGSDNAQWYDTQINDEVTQANTLLTEIAQSNQTVQGGGQAASDLNDAMTQLSQLLPVQYTTQTSGAVGVTLNNPATGSAVTLVDDTGATQLTMGYNATNDQYTATDSGGNVTTFTSGLGGGMLDTLNTLYQDFGTQSQPALYASNSAPTYLDQLNLFAANLIEAVNSAHNANGGGNVFAPVTNSFNAGQMQVASGFVPDSSVATDVSNLQDQQQLSLGTTTFAGYLSNIQQQVGTEDSDAGNQATFQDTLYQQLQTQQQSVSGVSVDDEMVNIIKYQQIYQAAAKVIQDTSTMLNAVINAV